MSKRVLQSQHAGQRGFTLVELAIVLVVIGLIVGAVFKGQDLIEAARIKSTISQIEGVRVASGMFVDRYNALPGDYAEANAVLGGIVGITWADTGDGDGIVEGNGIDDESLVFWQHLGAADMAKDIQLAASPTTTFGIGLPSTSVGGGLTVKFQEVKNKTTHWIRLGDAASNPTGVVDSQMAREIDVKMDDGRPDMGAVRNSTSACQTGSAGAAATYLTASIQEQCLLNFEL